MVGRDFNCGLNNNERVGSIVKHNEMIFLKYV